MGIELTVIVSFVCTYMHSRVSFTYGLYFRLLCVNKSYICIYIWIYVFICEDMSVDVHICVYMWIYLYMCKVVKCLNVYVTSCVYVSICVQCIRVHVQSSMSFHMSICVHICICASCVYVHKLSMSSCAHVNKCIRIYSHIHM